VARLLEGVSAQVALDIAHERRLNRGSRAEVGSGDGTTTDGMGSVDPALAREALSFTVALLEHMPALRAALNLDVEALFAGDPAVRSREEIILAYPCVLVISIQRLAHVLYRLRVPLLPRMLTEYAHERTGCDIHPGARLGSHFFIDHGTGVVIGETAIVGTGVRLYQHVTLGARSPLGAARRSPRERYARHPIVGDDVVIYAGATILGRVTIGDGATIGGNVWLLDDVPAGGVVVQPEATLLAPSASLALRDTLVAALV